ncbi:hypothetical protein F3Y22_tig00009942pilonHSYRG00148 [Hibiscus syriacus]|uniref:RNase H type-1 domain-containing protein n=1 Tax=Hibiscus syriacus TaxID=106335 RepID=A0A6A3CB17_HIBSY|nr:hypothetical protein F3Y22_tig00009942pilonHSYRG00148 [Hibiscus syriacus]
MDLVGAMAGMKVTMAISTSWNVLRDSIAWSIGNDSIAHPLDDVWIPHLGPLRRHLRNSNDVNRSILFADLVDQTGKLDMSKLTTIMNSEVIPHIISTKSHDGSDVDDSLFWRESSEHSFEIKLAYARLTEPTGRTNSKSGSTSGLLTFLNSVADYFFHLNLEGWLSVNLLSCATVTQWNLNWPTLFAPTLWQIWKNRNDEVFSNISHLINVVCNRSITWARYHAERNKPPAPAKVSDSIHTHWNRPKQGRLCLNVDGAVSTQTGVGTTGGVFRDCEGSWLLGFSKTIGMAQLLQTELWAIYIGLQVAWEQGFELLLIQTDSLQAVHLLEAKNALSSSLFLVRAIDKLRRKAWITNIQWTPRRNNAPADALAKLAVSSDHSTTIYREPPTALLRLLDIDKINLLLT